MVPQPDLICATLPVQAMLQKTLLEEAYQVIQDEPIVQEYGISLDQFVWAACQRMSRAFNVPPRAGGDLHALPMSTVAWLQWCCKQCLMHNRSSASTNVGVLLLSPVPRSQVVSIHSVDPKLVHDWSSDQVKFATSPGMQSS